MNQEELQRYREIIRELWYMGESVRIERLLTPEKTYRFLEIGEEFCPEAFGPVPRGGC